jgi:signal transduction histidine kinase
MADSPERVLQRLVDTALELCSAESAGLSLLEEENGRKIFRWHGVAGQYAPYLWGTTPREFSPCGTVLDTDKLQLMSQLDRHFTYFSAVQPRISEALLVPFHVAGQAVGTIWVISHNPNRRFDAEDARVMSTLGEFAAAAYQTLSALIALRAIVATVRNPLLVLDGGLHVKLASQSYYETFQETAGMTEGRGLAQLGNGQWDIPELGTLLSSVLSQGRALDNFEVKRDFPSIGTRVMSLNARRLSTDGNPAARILLAIEDITSRKQVEEELLRSSEDAQRFAYVAAHDLRAPLNTAMMLLQLLSQKTEGKLGENEQQALSMATDNLRRLKSLMSDILSYSQVGGSENKVTVSLKESLESALANLQKDLLETKTEVSFGLLPTVQANPSQLTLVFQNLISNALKFRSEQSPRLRIAATRENRETVVSVADNGEGFDPGNAQQIFLPFKRLHGPETPGSGIGLATCKRIIERMGGRIWAEAAPGTGATFYFTLPDE